MNMYESWMQEAERLEKLAKEKRELARKHKHGMENIKIGILIRDLNSNLIMEVTSLKNGSIDFGAKEYGKPNSIGRGYCFIVSNWEIYNEEGEK